MRHRLLSRVKTPAIQPSLRDSAVGWRLYPSDESLGYCHTPLRGSVGVDVMLATDMLTLAFKDRYDVAILVSSDADYKHAIEAVKFEIGKTVELRQVVGSKAYDLITAASVYKPITAGIISDCLRS